MTDSSIDLCVVIPVCNEAENIVTVVAELCETLAAVSSLQRITLLIVDDFSQDNGIALLKDWFREQQPRGVSLTFIRLQHRHGMSLALLKGFKLATTWSPRMTLVMDGDGQDDPQFIVELVTLAAQNDIAFALRGKRSEAWPFRLCYAAFQALMWLGTGHSARANQFCLMQTQVLAYVAALNHIDYLGALLHASPFSRAAITAARRPRGGGQSKFNFRSHTTTAFTIMSWHPRLLVRLHYLTLLLLLVLGIIATITASFFAITMLLVFALATQLCWAKINNIIAQRANSQPLTFDEQVETLTSDDDMPAQTA